MYREYKCIYNLCNYIRALVEKIITLSLRKGDDVLKPYYVPWANRWTAKGYGYFNTLEDAQKAIERDKKKYPMVVKLSLNEKEKLQQLAETRKTTISDIVRQAIEKEVMNNG